jgi:hypothetical protein
MAHEKRPHFAMRSKTGYVGSTGMLTATVRTSALPELKRQMRSFPCFFMYWPGKFPRQACRVDFGPPESVMAMS